jgi:cellulose synthase/poly-beta-1,6-N-acetylglucosamine synthase-like glycosyltransferase
MVDWLTAEYALTFEPRGASALGRSARWPALRVWRKPNSGKADSLNLGWRMARGEIVVTLDADTYIEPGALAAIRDGFVEDPNLGIAGGVLVPVCQRTSWAGFFQFFQTFEYARGFLWRLTWMQYDMLLLISGAFRRLPAQRARIGGRIRHDELGRGLRADPPRLPRCLRFRHP